MSLRERISHFWNDTLGVDCPEEIDISASNNPDDKELQESLSRVDEIEKKYKVALATSNKGGKSNSGKNIVEQVEVNSSKAIKQAEQKAVESKQVESKEER